MGALDVAVRTFSRAGAYMTELVGRLLLWPGGTGPTALCLWLRAGMRISASKPRLMPGPGVSGHSEVGAFVRACVRVYTPQ